MPQEFIVVKCFKCQNFQVHQLRKDCKFICKICGEKQSKKKVYGQGDAKNCRLAVQKLNFESLACSSDIEIDDKTSVPSLTNSLEKNVQNIDTYKTASKWDTFLEEDNDDYSLRSGNDSFDNSATKVSSNQESSVSGNWESSVYSLGNQSLKRRIESDSFLSNSLDITDKWKNLENMTSADQNSKIQQSVKDAPKDFEITPKDFEISQNKFPFISTTGEGENFDNKLVLKMAKEKFLKTQNDVQNPKNVQQNKPVSLLQKFQQLDDDFLNDALASV